MTQVQAIGPRRRPALSPLVTTSAVAAGLVGAAAVDVSQAAWLLVTVGGLVLTAARCDLRRGRIPNELVVAGWVTVVCAAVLLVIDEGVSPSESMMRVGFGVASSGAAALFIIWLLTPKLVGGGDWKLLSVVGGALGLLSAPAAAVAGITAVAVQLLASLVLRRRVLPFGPAIAVGLTVGIVSLRWLAQDGAWS